MSYIKLGIVVPCFNESAIILDTIETIRTLSIAIDNSMIIYHNRNKPNYRFNS